MNKTYNISNYGSSWLRADFHLHTKADKEFDYSGKNNNFIRNYIDKLKVENIKVGIITNHNKFDLQEFKALSKKARKEEIFLLPGVELSVNDGANEIHCLIVFDEKEWIVNGNDYINQFLSSTFAGKHNYENENGRSNDNLITTIKKLNGFNRDYFIILAHIEQRSGFYNELEGGRIIEFGNNPLFRKRVLAFQKVKTRDYIENLKSWLSNKLPAFVEGSDPKTIEEIGNGKKSFIKIGAYNFTAVKYALLDYKYRLSDKFILPKNGYIKSISFQGGKLNGTTIHLNNSMNNLIGIRGSGKSSILETIRYALDIELNKEHNVDFDYKSDLVQNVLGSGGKIICTFVDNQKKEYRSEKIFGDRTNIYYKEELQYNLKPSAIIRKPIYFGQKDLSQVGSKLSNKFFIEKIIGENLSEIKNRISEKNQEIVKTINEIKNIEKKLKRKEEYEEKKAELVNKIKIFKEKNIDKKLEKQVSFNKDLNFINRIKSFEKKIINKLTYLFDEYKGSFQEYKPYDSKENKNDIDNILNSISEFEEIFLRLEQIIIELNKKNTEIDKYEQNILGKYEILKEEFSKIKREIKEPNIQPDDYVKYTRTLDLTNAQLKELDKLTSKKSSLKKELEESLIELQKLWHNECEIIKKEILKINSNQKSIKISVEFKGDKDYLKKYLKEKITGSNIRDPRIQDIIENYSDFINIYFDLNKEKIGRASCRERV